MNTICLSTDSEVRWPHDLHYSIGADVEIYDAELDNLGGQGRFDLISRWRQRFLHTNLLNQTFVLIEDLGDSCIFRNGYGLGFLECALERNIPVVIDALCEIPRSIDSLQRNDRIFTLERGSIDCSDDALLQIAKFLGNVFGGSGWRPRIASSLLGSAPLKWVECAPDSVHSLTPESFENLLAELFTSHECLVRRVGKLHQADGAST